MFFQCSNDNNYYYLVTVFHQHVNRHTQYLKFNIAGTLYIVLVEIVIGVDFGTGEDAIDTSKCKCVIYS